MRVNLELRKKQKEKQKVTKTRKVKKDKVWLVGWVCVCRASGDFIFIFPGDLILFFLMPKKIRSPHISAGLARQKIRSPDS